MGDETPGDEDENKGAAAPGCETGKDEQEPDGESDNPGRFLRLWHSYRENAQAIGVIATSIGVVIALVGVNVAWHALDGNYEQIDNQVKQQEQQNENIQKQLEAQRAQSAMAIEAQLSDRYARAVTMLGSDQEALRVEAIEELVEVLNSELQRDTDKDTDSPDIDRQIKDTDRIVHILAVFAFSRTSFGCEARPDFVGDDVQQAIDQVGSLQFHGNFALAYHGPGWMGNPAWDAQGGAYQYGGAPPRPTDVPRHCWRGVLLSRAYPALSFTGIDIPKAVVAGADLHLSTFSGVNLAGLVAKGADLSDAKFDEAKLMEARFAPDYNQESPSGAAVKQDRDKKVPQYGWEARYSLSRTDFTRAWLCRASIDGDVSSTVFTGAKLYGADLSRARNLDPAKLVGVEYDTGERGTKWPTENGFKPPPPMPPANGRADCS